MKLLSKIKKNKLKSIFILFLALSIIYIGFIKTSFYESRASITIKNIDDNSSANSLLGLVSGKSSNTSEDAMILQEYLKSYEVYDKLDKKFNLSEYYASSDIDFLQRMNQMDTYEDYLIFYNKQLQITYDEISNITIIKFVHIDANIAQEIVKFLISEAEKKLNEYNKRTASKQLHFVINETNKQKVILEESIKVLSEYQDEEKTINPNSQVETNVSLLSSLKVKLVESKANLEKISKYLTDTSFEIIDLKREISETESSISQIQKEQSGEGKKTLNKSIFEFEKLKTQVDLNTELYKQALLQEQTSRVEVNKENKTLQILVNASLGQSYSEPRRMREILTVFLVLSLLYGILSMINAIIKDHKE
jgi:capsular polysaccharide transport system permease protein